MTWPTLCIRTDEMTDSPKHAHNERLVQRAVHGKEVYFTYIHEKRSTSKHDQPVIPTAKEQPQYIHEYSSNTQLQIAVFDMTTKHQQAILGPLKLMF